MNPPRKNLKTGGERSLGHNPFDDPIPENDPFLEALDRIAHPDPQEKPDRSSAEVRASVSELLASLGLRQLLDNPSQERLQAFRSEIGASDRFGLALDSVSDTLPLLLALYRHYFRVESRGIENLPSAEPVVLAGNHAGLLPFDAAMVLTDCFLHTTPPRLPRGIVDRWVETLPWVRDYFAEVGQVIGTRKNFRNLLNDGQCVLVFPEGINGIRKPFRERYRLQEFHTGFVEEALRAGASIVPFAVIGSDDQAPLLYDIEPLARWLGIPVAPVTPTFPWLGLLGLLPLPVRYRIVYAQPLRVADAYGPEAAEDPRVVTRLSETVRERIQGLLDGRHDGPHS